MAVPISNVTRRTVFAPSGTGPYAFTFEILAATDIEVYKGDTLLTLTTDYTVTINPNGTGSVTLVLTAGTDNITIVGARAIERTTDFVTGGDFFANTVNTELDSLTIFAQQNSEAVTRSIQAPVTDPTTIDMTLPVKASRAGKYLSFNASTGDPEVVNTVVDVSTVAAIASDVTTVSGIAANVTSVANNASNINTVAGISSNVTTVAGISGNVTTVAGISSAVSTVAADGTDIGTVATNIANVNAVGGSIANVNTVAGISANVTTVAGISSNVTTVAGISGNVTTVAGISADVTTVAADGTDIGTVAGLSTEITALGPIASDITTVSGISANVTSVAGNASNINQVASDTVAINAASANATAAANSATAAASSATDAANSAAAANAVSLGNEPIAPSIRPSLNLDFANVKALDPRITFTRTTTATYYDGVTTAKAEENLLLDSQTFATTWTTVAGSVTDNTDNAPDGTATADSVFEQASTNSHRIAQSLTLVSGQTYTVSVFAKQILDREFQIAFAAGDVSGNPRANFDLTNGTLGTVDSGLTATITASTNGFYRCSVTFTAADSSFVLWLSVITEPTAARAESYAGDITKGVILWGAQLEQRSAVSSYTPTTTQAITNYIPVLQTAASGVARFDHNPTTGESLGLLVEEQRTNVCLQSENFGLTWTPTRASVTTDIAVAPDGTLTADKLIANTDNNTHFLNQTLTVTANTNYSYSLYAKAGEYNNIRIRYGKSGSPFTRIGIIVNLTTGAITNSDAGTPTSVALRSATPVGNGWYRIVVAGIFDTTSTDGFLEITNVDNSGNTTFTGDGYSGIYIWGAQLEAGAFPTSYIATTSASVTRNADAASMTGTNFSSWYRADEGTLYAEWNSVGSLSDNRIGYAISNGTFNDTMYLLAAVSSISNLTQQAVRASAAGQATLNVTAAYTNFAYRKTAFGYKTDNFAISGDGASAVTDTLGTIPVVDRLILGSSWSGGSNFLGGTIKKLAYYPARLTNAQLQALTS